MSLEDLGAALLHRSQQSQQYRMDCYHISSVNYASQVFILGAVLEEDQAIGPARSRIGHGGEVHHSVRVPVQRRRQRTRVPSEGTHIQYIERVR